MLNPDDQPLWYLYNTIQKVANRRSKENFLKIVGEAVEDIEELEILLDTFEKYELPMGTVCVALSESIPKIQEIREKTES